MGPAVGLPAPGRNGSERARAMSSDQDAKAGGRRQFLKLASLGAVAGTVAAVTGEGERPAQAAEPEPQGKGYRETAHVRKVYELARF
jgi:hypothetical protein